MKKIVKQNSPFSRHKRNGTLLAIAVVIVGMLVSVGMYFVVEQREEKLLHSEFEKRVQELVLAIQREAQTSLTIISSLSAFYQASNEITAEEFKIFTAPLLEHRASLHAIGMNDIVALKDLQSYEAMKREKSYPYFQALEKTLNGQLVPVQERAEYVIVGHVEPYAENKKAIGFDIASDPMRREAVIRAIKTLEPAATGPLVLVQEEEGGKGFLLIVPVPKDQIAGGEFAVDELVVGVFRTKPLFEHVLTTIPRVDVDFKITDKDLAGNDVLLFEHSTESKVSSENKGLSIDSDIIIGGRAWRFSAWPTSSFVAEFSSLTPANVLVCGSLFTFVVFVYLLVLNDLNDKFHSSEEKFRLLSENIRGVFWIMGPHAKDIHYISPSFKKIFGFDPEEAYANPRVFIKAIHPDDRKKVVEAFNELSYGMDFHEEWRVLLPNGEVRWLLSHGYPVIRGIGDVEYVVGLASDITAQKRAEIERDKLRVQIVEDDEDETWGPA